MEWAVRPKMPLLVCLQNLQTSDIFVFDGNLQPAHLHASLRPICVPTDGEMKGCRRFNQSVRMT